MATIDVDYVTLTAIIGAAIGDTAADPDTNPDWVTATEGTVTFTPNIESVNATNDAGKTVRVVPFPIVCLIDAQGRLTYNGDPSVTLMDLGSSKVNPSIPRDKAAYNVTFTNVKMDAATVKMSSFGINPDPADAVSGSINLWDIAPLATGAGGAAIVRGQGLPSITTAAAGDVVAYDGTDIKWGPLTVAQVPNLSSRYSSGRTFLHQPQHPVTNRFPLMVAGLLSDGVKTDCNTWTKHTVVRPTESVTFVVTNITDGTSAAAPNDVTYRIGVRSQGAMTPVFFRGQRDISVSPDGLAISDPVAMPLNAGDTIEVHMRASVTTPGQKWVRNTLTDNTVGEGTIDGTSGADLTLTGAVTPNRSYGVAPFAILAAPVAGTARTLIGIGDSIMQEQHDTDGGVSGVSTLGWGFARRFANATSLPFVNLGCIGDTATGWASGAGRKWATRQQFAASAGVILCNFGVNDLAQSRTLAQIQGDLTTIWTSFHRLGIPVWQTTLTPATTSTDSWATTANQTPAASEPIRVALNDWIRTKPSPLAGYAEMADSVETARNSGIWQPDFTDDGTHPLPIGHAAMAAVLGDTTIATALV